MSENEGGESRTMTAFIMGFVVGCLLCLGAGGAFFWTQNRRLVATEMEARMQAEEARMMAEQARDAELRARQAAEAQRAAAERARRVAVAEVERVGKNKGK